MRVCVCVGVSCVRDKETNRTLARDRDAVAKANKEWKKRLFSRQKFTVFFFFLMGYENYANHSSVTLIKHLLLTYPLL